MPFGIILDLAFGFAGILKELRNRLESFRRLYLFLSQVIPFGNSKLEKFDAYLRFLETKLPAREGTGHLDLDDEVKLKFYRLQKISEGSIALDPGTPGTIKGPSDVGTGRIEDEKVLRRHVRRVRA